MKSVLRSVFVVWLACAGLLPVLAQDEGLVSVPVGEGYTVSIPEAWTVEDDGEGFVIASDEAGITMQFTDPALLPDLVDIEDVAGPAELLTKLNETLLDIETDANSVNKITLGELDAVTVSVMGEADNTISAYLITFDDELFGYANALVDAEAEDGTSTVETIVASFAPAEATNEPCTIMAEAENTVRVRTGPGATRAALVFLPTDETFTPIDSTTVDDGSLWFQMDIDQVLPGSAAAALWVAADEVTASGGCDVLAPPSATLAEATPTEATSEPDTEAVSSPGGNTPQAGTWTRTLATTTTVVCGGSTPQYLATEQIIEELVDTAPLSLTEASGDVFVFAGDTYTRDQPDRYILTEGSLIEGDFINVLAVVGVESSAAMSGGITFSFVEQGVSCSVSIPFTMTAN